jgi:hypothetical protein
VQLVVLLEEPGAQYVPDVVHVEQLEAPAPEYVPSPHVEHVPPAKEYVPASQFVQGDAVPTGPNREEAAAIDLPASQFTHVLYVNELTPEVDVLSK